MNAYLSAGQNSLLISVIKARGRGVVQYDLENQGKDHASDQRMRAGAPHSDEFSGY